MIFSHLVLLLLLSVCAAKVMRADELYFLLQKFADNPTALQQLQAPSWVNSPIMRGTMGIILTCVVTLISCVYSVLHLNIPAETGKYTIFLTKMKWVLVTLLVPDTVLVIALGEYMEAIELQSRLRQLKIDMNDHKMVSTTESTRSNETF